MAAWRASDAAIREHLGDSSTRRSYAAPSGCDSPVPAAGVGQLVHPGHRLGPLPRQVEDVHAASVVDRLGKSLPSLVLLELEVEPGQTPDQHLDHAAAPATRTVGG